MRLPRFVEQQHINMPVEHFLDFLRVIHYAIVSALRQHEQFRLFRFILNQRIRLDFCLNRFHGEFRLRNRPDDAEFITRRTQKYRIRAGHDDGVQIRFMTIAIDHDHVARCDVGVPNHFVGR